MFLRNFSEIFNSFLSFILSPHNKSSPIMTRPTFNCQAHNYILSIQKTQISIITTYNFLIPKTFWKSFKHNSNVMPKIGNKLCSLLITFRTRESQMIIFRHGAFTLANKTTRNLCIIVELNIRKLFHNAVILPRQIRSTIETNSGNHIFPLCLSYKSRNFTFQLRHKFSAIVEKELRALNSRILNIFITSKTRSV